MSFRSSRSVEEGWQTICVAGKGLIWGSFLGSGSLEMFELMVLLLLLKRGN